MRKRGVSIGRRMRFVRRTSDAASCLAFSTGHRSFADRLPRHSASSKRGVTRPQSIRALQEWRFIQQPPLCPVKARNTTIVDTGRWSVHGTFPMSSFLASPAGFEPTAPGLGILCSILLSYGDNRKH
jgi:hypothetical protein